MTTISASASTSITSTSLNETHDSGLRSWVASANDDITDFPIQNLPYGVFRRGGSAEAFRIGVAIGDQILDVNSASVLNALSRLPAATLAALASERLNALMALGQPTWSALRLALSRLLREGAPPLEQALVAQADAEYYTDFYTSIYHATAVGKLFRPDEPLLPNYKWVPIGYHGRASSIGVSGQQFHRPLGQTRAPGATEPGFGPAKRLDYEMEVGIFIGPGNAQGEPIAIGAAEQAVFGLCLLNDWSARDLQAWEYQPLGPFLAKNFATTISPWIVTLEALAPYRSAWQRDGADPQPLPYLDSASLRTSGALDVQLEVLLQTALMRRDGVPAARISLSNFRHSYWSVSQLVTHHTVNGCNLVAGDLLGSGTQSGPTPAEAGSLIELSAGGKQPITLPNGETRTFLDDGDTIVMRGWAEREGAVRIGFGEVSGTLLPARNWQA